MCIHVDRGCTCKVSQQDITLSTLSVLLISSQQCSGSTSQSDSTVSMYHHKYVTDCMNAHFILLSILLPSVTQLLYY